MVKLFTHRWLGGGMVDTVDSKETELYESVAQVITMIEEIGELVKEFESGLYQAKN